MILTVPGHRNPISQSSPGAEQHILKTGWTVLRRSGEGGGGWDGAQRNLLTIVE
jgi:hypothetical protein